MYSILLVCVCVWLVIGTCKQKCYLSEREIRNAPLDYVSAYSLLCCRSVPVYSWDMSGVRDQI